MTTNDQSSRLISDAMRFMPGVDYIPLDMKLFKPSNVSKYLAFVIDKDWLPSSARRLSELFHPFKIENASSSYQIPGSNAVNSMLNSGQTSGYYSQIPSYTTLGARSRNARNKSSVIGSGSLNAEVEIVPDCQYGSHIHDNGDSVDCGNSFENTQTEHLAASVQVFFVLFRMLECYPESAEFDKIVHLLMNAAREIESCLPDMCREDIMFPFSDLPNAPQLKKYMDSRRLLDTGSQSATNSRLVHAFQVLTDVYNHVGSYDFWNGPVRDDVDLFNTIDFVNQCSICESSNFNIRYCDHVKRNEKKGDSCDGVVKRYITVLSTNGWSDDLIKQRVRFCMWCIQNKFLSVNYGEYNIWPYSLSSFNCWYWDSVREGEKHKVEATDNGPSSTKSTKKCSTNVINGICYISPEFREMIQAMKLPIGPKISCSQIRPTDGFNIWYDIGEKEWGIVISGYLKGCGLSSEFSRQFSQLDMILSPMMIGRFRAEEKMINEIHWSDEAPDVMMQFYYDRKWDCFHTLGEKYKDSFGGVIFSDRTFRCPDDYLRDLHIVWNKQLPQYYAFVAAGFMNMFPGLAMKTREMHISENIQIQSARSQLKMTQGSSATPRFSNEYQQHAPTVSYTHRENKKQAIEEVLTKKLQSDLLRAGYGIPGFLKEMITATVLYTKKKFYFGWYMTTHRSEEANTSDTQRFIWRNYGNEYYEPICYLHDDPTPTPYYRNLSPSDNYHLNCVRELRTFYHIDTNKSTIAYSIALMMLDSLREERNQHIHVALSSVDAAGVGKTFLVYVISHILLSGMFREVGYESAGVKRIQQLGRGGDVVIFRDEATMSLFRSTTEGNLGDARSKQMLSQGVTNSKTLRIETKRPQPYFFNQQATNVDDQVEEWVNPIRQTRKRVKRTEQSEEDKGRPKKKSKGYQSTNFPTQSHSVMIMQQQDQDIERRNVYRTFEEIGCWLTTTNFLIKNIKDVAMIDRFFEINITTTNGGEEGARLSLTSIIDSVPIGVRNRWRMIQMAYMEIRKLITAGDCKMSDDIVTIMKHIIKPTLDKYQVDKAVLERHYIRVGALASIIAIHRLIRHFFLSPSGLYYRKRITASRLSSLEPFLFVTFQDASFAFGAFLSQLITPVDRYGIACLKYMWASGSNRVNPFDWKKKTITKPKKVVSYSQANEGYDENYDIADISGYSIVSEETEEDLNDYNYILLRGYTEKKFVAYLFDEMKKHIETNQFLNVNIPESADISNWVKKHTSLPVVRAKRMVTTMKDDILTEDWIKTGDTECEKGARRKKKKQSEGSNGVEDVIIIDSNQDKTPKKLPVKKNTCHPNNIIVMDGVDSDVLDVKCIEFINTGVLISTYWLLHGGSLYDDLIDLLGDIHGHNIAYSSESKTGPKGARIYNDLLIGSPSDTKVGKYKSIKPGKNYKRISKYKIPRMCCPEYALEKKEREKSIRSSDLSPNSTLKNVPNQNLNQLVMNIHLRKVLHPNVGSDEQCIPSFGRNLSDFEFVFGVAFLVMDTSDNRDFIYSSMSNPSIVDRMIAFVDYASMKIPDDCLLIWFFRTKFSVLYLRVLFCQRYFIMLTSPHFILESNSSLYGNKFRKISLFDPMTSADPNFQNYFSRSTQFIEHFRLIHTEAKKRELRNHVLILSTDQQYSNPVTNNLFIDTKTFVGANKPTGNNQRSKRFLDPTMMSLPTTAPYIFSYRNIRHEYPEHEDKKLTIEEVKDLVKNETYEEFVGRFIEYTLETSPEVDTTFRSIHYG